MRSLRRQPLVIVIVDLYRDGRAAVVVEPAEGRWPLREGPDKLVIPLHLAALALARADTTVNEWVRSRLRSAATRLANLEAGREMRDPCSAVADVTLVARDGAADARIELRLVRSSVGPVATVARAHGGSPMLSQAAAVLLCAHTRDLEPDAPLALALCVEGLLGWYHEADPHLQPPLQAVAYALRHAASRLEEAGRPVPVAMTAAIDEHREIRPMAGGA